MAERKGAQKGTGRQEGPRIPRSELRVVDVVQRENASGIALKGRGSVAAALHLFAAFRAARPQVMEIAPGVPLEDTFTVDLTPFVRRDNEAAAQGLTVLSDRGLVEDETTRDTVSDVVIRKVLPKLAAGERWDWRKPHVGHPFDGGIDVHPIEGQDDAYMLRIGYGDNTLERNFARSLGVERGIESATLDVVLDPGADIGFRVDFGTVARRIRGIYAGLDGFETGSGREEPYSGFRTDGSRPELTGESIVSQLQATSETPWWTMLGVKGGVDLSLYIADIGHQEYRGGRMLHDWRVDGTTVTGELGIDLDGHGGRDVRLPTLRFNIGQTSDRVGIMRKPAVNPEMKATIRALSEQVKAVFPINS